MADTALPVTAAWSAPVPPTPGGAADAKPSVGAAPDAPLGTVSASAGAASAVVASWSAPSAPTPAGAADAAPSVGAAPGAPLGTVSASAGAASVVQAAWSAPTPPTPGGAAAAAPSVGPAPGAPLDAYTPPVGQATAYAGGWITIAANTVNPSIVIGGVTWSKTETFSGADPAYDAASIATYLNETAAIRALVFAYPATSPHRVALRAVAMGTTGNDVTLSSATSGIALSGATLTGGYGTTGAAEYATATFAVTAATASDLSITINGTTLTNLGGYTSTLANRRLAAGNICDRINAASLGVYAHRDGADLTRVQMIALTAGTAGNVALATNYSGVFDSFPAAMAGGTAAATPQLPAPLPILP